MMEGMLLGLFLRRERNSPLRPLGSDVSIEQDNTSTIQLARNGWKSSSKKPNTTTLGTFI